MIESTVFSKVFTTVALCSNFIKALTFENVHLMM